MQAKFNRLSTAMDWVGKLLQSIDATPEPPVINLSELSGEITFILKGHRWKLALKEEAKPEIDDELKRLLEAEARGTLN